MTETSSLLDAVTQPQQSAQPTTPATPAQPQQGGSLLGQVTSPTNETNTTAAPKTAPPLDEGTSFDAFTHGLTGAPETAGELGTSSTARPVENYGFTRRNMAYNAGDIGYQTFQFARGLVSDLVGKTDVLKDDKGHAISDPKANTLLAKYITAPSEQERQKSHDEAVEYFNSKGTDAAGHLLNSVLHGTLGEYIPGIGPFVMSLVDKAESGDIGGAVTQVATLKAAESAYKAGRGGVEKAAKILGANPLSPEESAAMSAKRPAAAAPAPTPTQARGTVRGESKYGIKPTVQTTAGVEAPVSALQGDEVTPQAKIAARLTTPGAAQEFQKSQTAPAATRQAVSTVGQVAEDLINRHDAIVNGAELPEQLAGTQTPSKFESFDDIAKAAEEKAVNTTYQKADEISAREAAEHQRQSKQAISAAKEATDHYNQLVDEHNSQLGPDEQPMEHQTFDPSSVELPEKPKGYGELKGAVDRAKANSRSADASVRQEAFDNELPKAEKALDQWFRSHSDEISPEEYDSAKKLRYSAERFKEVANGLRRGILNNNVTGNTMRGIEATMDNKKNLGPGTFRRLLGDEGYNNWREVARLFDPIKDAPAGIKAWGQWALEYTAAHLLGPLGLVGKAGTELLLNKVMFDHDLGKWFRNATDELKTTTTEAAKTGEPVRLSSKLASTFKALWKNERGTAAAPGLVPLTEEEEQLAAHHEFGGSTFAGGKNLSGADKYSVGSYPERTHQVEGDLTAGHLQKFKQNHADLFSQEDHAVGTWKDQDTGKHVLDVAKIYDDRDEAVNAGRAANQKAIYHLGGEGEIPTGGTGEGSISTPDPVVNNASGESAASQEAINRTASEKTNGVTRVKILRNGQEIPLIGPDAVDATAGPGETIVKRSADGQEEIQDQGRGARYNPRPEQYSVLSKALQPDMEGSEIATRRPTSKRVEATNAPGQYSDMNGVRDASQAQPGGDGKLGYAEKLARTVSKYSGLDFTDEQLKSPRAVMEKFINRMTDNLVALHNAIPEPMRDTARNWYDTANKMSKTMAQKYDVSHEQAAGILAALSPQNAWDNNVALADRVLDTYKNRQNFKFSPKMETASSKVKQGQLSKAGRGVLRDISGKTLSEIADQPIPERLQRKWKDEAPEKWRNVKAAQQAMWVRLYDEAHNSAENPMFHPNGDVVGISPNNRSWIGLDHIAKAIRIINDGNVEAINSVMGDGNKIRNFYNNIINPNSKNGHVTVDTHAVGAAHFQPFSGDDPEVQHNFGNSPKGIPGAPKHAGTGMRGTYPLYAEAYRRAAEKLGLQPRELQSITWEGTRSLMGDDKKTPELKSFARDIWQKVQERELTPKQAREMIIEKAGGFSKPSWMTDEQWDAAMGTGFDPEEFK